MQDNGAGFTPEAMQKAVGAVLHHGAMSVWASGLTVTRKIIETHHGKLELVPPATGRSGIVRISLPLDSAPAEG